MPARPSIAISRPAPEEAESTYACSAASSPSRSSSVGPSGCGGPALGRRAPSGGKRSGRPSQTSWKIASGRSSPGDARLAEVAELHAGLELVLDERRRRPRDEDLAAVPEVADPGGLVHGEADVARRRSRRPRPVCTPTRTRTAPSSGQPCAAIARCAAAAAATAVAALRKTKKKASPWRSISVPLVRAEGLPQQRVVLREQGAVALAAELLQEPRRALDVREEKGDRPGGEVRVCRHVALPTPSEPASVVAARDGTSGRPEPGRVSGNFGGQLGVFPDCGRGAAAATVARQSQHPKTERKATHR